MLNDENQSKKLQEKKNHSTLCYTLHCCLPARWTVWSPIQSRALFYSTQPYCTVSPALQCTVLTIHTVEGGLCSSSSLHSWMHWQYTPVQSVQPLTNYYGVHSTVHQRVADSFSTAPPPKSSLHCPRLYWLLLLWLYKLYYVLFKSRTFVLTPLALSSTVQTRAQQSAVP
jgi:hypothetical protein